MIKRVGVVRAGERVGWLRPRLVVVYGEDPEAINATARALFLKGKLVRVLLAQEPPPCSPIALWCVAEPYLVWRAHVTAPDWRELVRDYYAHCVARRTFANRFARLELLKALEVLGRTKRDFERYLRFLFALRRETPLPTKRERWRKRGWV